MLTWMFVQYDWNSLIQVTTRDYYDETQSALYVCTGTLIGPNEGESLLLMLRIKDPKP